MNFCQQFLEFLSRSVPESSGKAHFFFEFDAPNKSVSMRQVADGEMRRSILPQWYIDSTEHPP